MHNNYKIIKPVGLKSACEVIDNICRNASRFRRSERIPGPFLIYLSKGNGQTTLGDYMEEMFERNKVIGYTGIDHKIVLDFKDSLKPLEIHDQAAVYSKEFSGIEIHCLTDDFADMCYENNLHGTYMEKSRENSQTAALVIFVPEKPGKSLERLIAYLTKEIIFEYVIKPAAYKQLELVEIAEREIIKTGTIIRTDIDVLRNKLLKLIIEKGINTSSEAAKLGKDIVFSADYTEAIPSVGEETLLTDSSYPEDLYTENNNTTTDMSSARITKIRGWRN